MTYEDADRLSAIKLDELDEQLNQERTAELWERYEAAIENWDDDGIGFDPHACELELRELQIEAIHNYEDRLVALIDEAIKDLQPIKEIVTASKTEVNVSEIIVSIANTERLLDLALSPAHISRLGDRELDSLWLALRGLNRFERPLRLASERVEEAAFQADMEALCAE
jgi:phosphorylcholine metabolism protein LicD